jgi:hypothetical protein
MENNSVIKPDIREFSGVKYKVVKIPCKCICHQKGMSTLHVRPCCNNGFKEKLIKL